MTIFDAIQARRSVRSYDPTVIDRSMVQTLLVAAVQAPTAIHQEPWAFAILQDRAALKRLSDLGKPLFADVVFREQLDSGGHGLEQFRQPEFNIFYDAGTLIVICARPLVPFAAADCWLAAENLMLAACGLGLGTCVIGSALPVLNTQDGKSEIGIPSEFAAIAPIVVGVPKGQPSASARNDPIVLSWKQ